MKELSIYSSKNYSSSRTENKVKEKGKYKKRGWTVN